MKQALEIDDLPELAELLTAAEAADYLRISECTLRHWVSDKKVRFIKIVAPCGSRIPTLTDFFRIMCEKRR
jgi:excisionase family DNA binding protein